jgi:uncharacterized protein (DUF2336 family)
MPATPPFLERQLPKAPLDRRVKLAANPATDPTILAALAKDDAVTVRVAVALNPSTPSPAQMQLASDLDERVRLLLARKLASALPLLPGAEIATKRDEVFAVLTRLVHDEAVRIRTEVANGLASLPDVPRPIVLALANDSAVRVSEPVLRLSPLLSADDLLGLLAAPPHAQTAAAIACRADLPAVVADAIAASADDPAIRNLLANRSAALREETLDRLVDRASRRPEWHLPLVQRPRLPESAARALSEILTGQLLEELAARPDLPASVLDHVRRRLANLPAVTAGSGTDGEVLAEAHRLRLRGQLTEAQLLGALQSGDARRACALLAVAAGVALGVVDRAVALRNTKGLVSLVWKAGFSPGIAGPVQTVLGRTAPDAILQGNKPGNFPLRPEEMTWQLDFIGAGC